MFLKHNKYTRKEIWKVFHPDEGEKPQGGNWDTGYVREGNNLIAFLNINTAGKTGHNFQNKYDEKTELITWFGKPNTNSEQPIFKKLLNKEITPYFFARWDNKDTYFTFLGVGEVMDFKDGVLIEDGRIALKMTVGIYDNLTSIQHEGAKINSANVGIPVFGKKISVVVNRYERNPEYKRKCLEHYGFDCQICGFSFKNTFGSLGEQFCHVHHIEPIGEMGGEIVTDPTKDLIPVCPNCHAMLHRNKTTLKPKELKAILQKKIGDD